MTIGIFILCASSTAAFKTLTEYCGFLGFAVGVNIPPVAIILMTFAPSFNCVRTACRTWSSVSASVPKNQQCPAVIVIGVPASNSRGPGTWPLSIISRTWKATSFREPRSRIVVTPASTAFRMLLVARIVNCWTFSVSASVCASGVALQCMCE